MTAPAPLDNPAEAAPARPAGTVILLHDGESGLEVLISRKATGKHFSAGALVFPGGSVCDADRAAAAGLDDPLGPQRLAALRELHEECGLVVAPPERLVHFAHWITPPWRGTRFDAHFFIAAARPDEMDPVVDGYEIVQAGWRRPADVLAEAEAGDVVLVLPMLMNLTKLSRWETVAAALAATREARVVQVMPERLEIDGEIHHRIPAEAGYGETLIAHSRFRKA